ncbi:peptidase associated/transthyretin-like domain-containing protein [Natronococcus roseus]|uniref:hypothetical protein n=1 Tax=Natronococcus roseus TaxID=1052014 RepID=UPI00374DD8FF
MSALAGCSTDDESANGSESESDDGNETDNDGESGDDAETDELEGETDEDGDDAEEEAGEDEDEDDAEPEEGGEDEDDTEADEDGDDTEAESESTDEDDDSAAEEPELSEFTLRVIDVNGDPAEAMLVAGEGEPLDADVPLEFTGVTGSEGYHHNRIYENEYTIEIDHPDYEGTTIEHTHDGPSEVTAELDVEVDTDEPDEDADPSEDEAPDHAELILRAVDLDGDPISGAVVSGEGEPHEADIPLEFTGITGGDGYHHNLIYENEYTIEVDHDDYEPTTVEHTHDGDSELTVELELE